MNDDIYPYDSEEWRRARVKAFVRAWAEDRQARVEHWRKHWHIELVEVLVELGGGFAFGVALALASVVYALAELAR